MHACVYIPTLVPQVLFMVFLFMLFEIYCTNDLYGIMATDGVKMKTCLILKIVFSFSMSALKLRH